MESTAKECRQRKPVKNRRPLSKKARLWCPGEDY